MRAARSIVIITLFAVLFCGCASASSGPKISRDKVNQIQKGITTREQVEALLGPPSSVGMMGEGRRTLFYMSVRGKARVGATAFVPFIGPALPGAVKSDSEHQSLQIFISKSGIVEDFEFSDTTTSTRQTGFGGMETTQTQNK